MSDSSQRDDYENEIAQKLREDPTELAYLLVHRDSLFYERRHTWVTFDPTRASPWLISKREPNQSALRSTSRLDVEGLHEGSKHDDGELVRTAFVPVEQTPIPYHDAPLVDVRCPNCPDTKLTVSKAVMERKRTCKLCEQEVTPVAKS